MVVRGRSLKRKNTKGWNLCVQWKDETTTWKRLQDIKESHTIQVTDYSITQGISNEPYFNWWVNHVIKKLEVIISALKGTASQAVKKNIKFGIRVPQIVNEALRTDKNNCKGYQ